MQMQSNNRYVGNVTVTTTSSLLKLWWQVMVVVLVVGAGDLGAVHSGGSSNVPRGSRGGGSQDSSW